jgi:hypothetical protein
MTSKNSFCRQNQTPNNTMTDDGLFSVFGAGGRKAAGRGEAEKFSDVLIQRN